MNVDYFLTHKKLLVSIILVVSGVFILRTLLGNLDQVISSFSSVSLVSVLLSGLFYLCYFYCRAFSWKFILSILKHDLSTEDSLATWFIGEAARFVPGNIWSFGNRIYLARQKGVLKSVTLISLAFEILLLLIVTSLLSVPALLTSVKILRINPFNNFFLILILVVTSGFVIFRNKLICFIDKLNEVPLSKITSRSFFLALLFQALAWISFGLGTYTLIVTVSKTLNPFIFISVPIFAWLIGYLSLLTPAGLGVREAALIVILGMTISPGKAALVAVFSRVVILLVEICNLVYWWYRTERERFLSLGKNLLRKWDLIILFLLVLAYISIFSTLSILRHNAFASNYDLSNMSQTAWNTLHGRFFALSGAENTISRFSIHADLILVLLSPLYLIWNTARVLLITQATALGLGGISVYFLSKAILSDVIGKNSILLKITALVFVLVYLLNPVMEWINIYDFHGVALAIPFLISAFYFAYTASRENKLEKSSRREWMWFWIFVCLALVTKEEISLVISSLGIVIFFVFKQKKVGLATFLIGILWFLTVIFVVIPHFSAEGQHWGINGLYDPAIQKIKDVKSITEFLDVFRGFFLIPQAFNYYGSLLKPFTFIPLLGLPWLLLAVPEFTINLLSSSALMISTTLHYDSGITPFLVIATIFGVKYLLVLLKVIKPLSTYQNLFLVAVLILMTAVAIRVNYHYSPLPTTPSCWCISYQVSQEDIEFEKVLQTIPANASVTSSGEIRPHVARRKDSFILPSGVESADYVAIIDQNRLVGDYSPKEFETQLLSDPQFLNSHDLLSHIGHFYLFKRN